MKKEKELLSPPPPPRDREIHVYGHSKHSSKQKPTKYEKK